MEREENNSKKERDYSFENPEIVNFPRPAKPSVTIPRSDDDDEEDIFAAPEQQQVSAKIFLQRLIWSVFTFTCVIIFSIFFGVVFLAAALLIIILAVPVFLIGRSSANIKKYTGRRDGDL